MPGGPELYEVGALSLWHCRGQILRLRGKRNTATPKVEEPISIDEPRLVNLQYG